MYRALAALLAPVTLLLPRIGGILALIAEFVLFFALMAVFSR